MKLSNLLQDVGRPVAYYPSLAKCLGGVKQAIFLCQLIYWLGSQANEEGWIYKQAKETEAETGLSREEQKTARKHLIKIGVLQERYARLDHTMYYRVNTDRLNELWEQHRENVFESSNGQLGNSANGQSGNASFSNAGKSNSGMRESRNRNKDSENTARNTARNTSERGRGNMSSDKHSTNNARTLSPEEEESINRIFAFWQRVMGHPNSKLNRKRKNAILYRLREGYSAHDIMLAVEGCRMSDYHMGLNDQERPYDDIELICRDGCKLEGFIEALVAEYSGYTHGKCKQSFDARSIKCPDCGADLNWQDVIEKRLQDHAERFKAGMY